MRIAVGRLRVLVGLSFSASRKPREEILYDKARAYAERSLIERYPNKSYRRFGVEHVVPQDRWRLSGLLDSRTATLLSEREAVLRVLDGRSPRWRSGSDVRVPHWRWHKRRVLTRELCKRNKIAKWW